MQGVDGNPRSVIPRTRTAHRQFVFGGVAFEVLADKTLRWELPTSFERHMITPGATAVFADVICSVSVERGLPPIAAVPRDVPYFRRQQERTEIFSAEVRADLSRVAASRYAAAARVTPGSEGLSAMLIGIASAIASGEGGLCLRAAGVEFAQRAVLFFAARTDDALSAANQCSPGTAFATQRVNLVFHAEQWTAHSLPSDGTSALSASTRLSLPVAAAVHVRPSHGQPTLVPLAATVRPSLLRESIELSDASTDAQPTRADRLARVCTEIPMFELQGAVDKPISPLLTALFAHTPPAV